MPTKEYRDVIHLQKNGVWPGGSVPDWVHEFLKKYGVGAPAATSPIVIEEAMRREIESLREFQGES